eukprot:CAMPEP_0175137578 /NCGR_PEP_ID=MMETSP0087-20121206/9889_1 /TAXON_ID=136419 /ORGANISM="Unknown Unknown, Strain D1" /LENGTH=588 /DNA_ID=CAMNT_0016420421 /DNA_START=308 /DNA_END=2074 /DNA_ORIENTATION=+
MDRLLFSLEEEDKYKDYMSVDYAKTDEELETPLYKYDTNLITEVTSDEQFQQVLKENDKVVADIYHPWCEKCSMQRNNFIIAARKYGANMKFIAVDTRECLLTRRIYHTSCTDDCSTFRVFAKFDKGDSQHDHTQVWNADEDFDKFDKQLSRASKEWYTKLTTFDSYKEHIDKPSAAKTKFVGLFHVKGGDFQVYGQGCKMPFIATTEYDCSVFVGESPGPETLRPSAQGFKQMGPDDTSALFAVGDWGEQWYTGEWEQDKVGAWMAQMFFGTIRDYTAPGSLWPSLARVVKETPVASVFCNKATFDKYRKELDLLSAQFMGRVFFFYISDSWITMRIENGFGGGRMEDGFMFFSLSKGLSPDLAKYNMKGSTFDLQKMVDHTNKYLSGAIVNDFYKKTAVFDTKQQGPVKVITYATSRKFTEKAKHDVCMVLYKQVDSDSRSKIDRITTLIGSSLTPVKFSMVTYDTRSNHYDTEQFPGCLEDDFCIFCWLTHHGEREMVNYTDKFGQRNFILWLKQNSDAVSAGFKKIQAHLKLLKKKKQEEEAKAKAEEDKENRKEREEARREAEEEEAAEAAEAAKAAKLKAEL